MLLKLLQEFYDVLFPKKEISYLYKLIDNIFIGITGGFYVFTQLDLEFEKDFIDIIYTSFEKQIYMHLFLREDLFELRCNSCGENDRISWDNLCFKCNFIKTF